MSDVAHIPTPSDVAWSRWCVFHIFRKSGMVEVNSLHETKAAALAEAEKWRSSESANRFRFSVMPVSVSDPQP